MKVGNGAAAAKAEAAGGGGRSVKRWRSGLWSRHSEAGSRARRPQGPPCWLRGL